MIRAGMIEPVVALIESHVGDPFEAARAMSDLRLQTVIDEAESLVYLKDAKGCYWIVNRLFVEHVGRSRDEIVGRSDQQIFAPGLSSALCDLDRQVHAVDGPIRVERRLAFSNAERVFRCNVFPLRNQAAEIYALGAILTDVTMSLEHEREREAQLRALGAARADAEQAVRGKDQFLSQLSHELRTPLNAMVGWLHVLQASALDPDLHARALEGITRSVDRQRQLVDDLQSTAIATLRDGGLGIGLKLPRAAASIDESPPVIVQALHLDEPGHGEEQAELHGVSVLAVDDHPEMRDVLATLLGRWGARVEMVGSADEARACYVRWARGPGERVIIADISMPEEDGRALIGSLRRLEGAHHLPRIPAIALSTHSYAADRTAAFRAGFDAFVAKPVDPPGLRRILAQLAGR